MIPNFIYNNWDYMMLTATILYFPLIPTGMLYNLQISLWGIFVLLIINETHRYHRNRYVLDKVIVYNRPKKRKQLSITIKAWILFTLTIITFYTWLVIYA